jgi:thiol-disulfide isomerase/thioredoxin
MDFRSGQSRLVILTFIGRRDQHDALESGKIRVTSGVEGGARRAVATCRRNGEWFMARLACWRTGLLAAVLLLAACGHDSGGAAPAIGARLPRVALTGLVGEAPTSTDDLRGTPLVINFWATWCLPCRDEMPALERLSHRLAANGVRVIGVAVDNDRYLAAEFVRSHRLTFPIYADSDTKQFQTLLGVKSLPETVLVSADGAIAARIVGARDWNGAEGARLLERALAVRLAPAR